MSGHEERNNTMSKMIELLKASGWVETTLGKCQLGDEVLTRRDKKVNVYTTVCGEYEREGLTVTEDGIFHEWTPVLRAPRPERPEYAPGTVALITWDEGDEHVRDLLPVRAMMGAEGAWRGAEVVPPRSLDRIEVIRVLLTADQDTPPITDEMVEHAAEALYNRKFGFGWDEDPWENEKDKFRELAREVLDAAFGGGES